MKELDELKESVDSLEKHFEVSKRFRTPNEQTEQALTSDCLNGIVKVLVVLTTPKPAA